MKKISPRLYPAIEWGILLLILAFFYLRGIGQVPPHGDESQWIATSYFFEAALDPQFIAPDWATQSHLTTNDLDEALKAQFPAWVKTGLGDLHTPNEPWDTYYWTLTQPMMVRYVIGRLHHLSFWDHQHLTWGFWFIFAAPFDLAVGEGQRWSNRQPHFPVRRVHHRNPRPDDPAGLGSLLLVPGGFSHYSDCHRAWQGLEPGWTTSTKGT
jgi:hypothetical protein